jgi:hypothetical protein
MEATKEFRVVRFCLESGQRYVICARFKNTSGRTILVKIKHAELKPNGKEVKVQ